MDEIEQFLEQLEHGNQSVTDGQRDRGTDKPKLISPVFFKKRGTIKMKLKVKSETDFRVAVFFLLRQLFIALARTLRRKCIFIFYINYKGIII